MNSASGSSDTRTRDSRSSVARRTGQGGRPSHMVAAMADAWGRGERVSAEEILERQPDLDTETAIRLVYEEVWLRREAGLEVDTSEVVGRFPRWAAELRDLFECDRMLSPIAGDVAWPEVGEALGPFQLLAELGRGACGRTYLAIEPGLADRPVVVKVIPGDHDEHLALARLRHTHIVPLFSEHSFPERDLRGLCMPYLGGASLSQILQGLADVPLSERSGRLLVELIDQNTSRMPACPSPAGPFRRGLEEASYAHAVVWVAACLADALHYAHARGLVHMDVKPSNVLITVDGQPMLLDFHLARAPISADDWDVDRLGGTPGWMAPEQVEAMEAVEDGRPIEVAVDGRADIYALGLLLRESLADPEATFDGEDTQALIQALPGVGAGLRDILRKCLADHPADRYRDAATLADDLRRHLEDLPLRGVRNRSPLERWQKWRRRHPGALAWCLAGLAITLAALGAVAEAVSTYRHRVGQVLLALEDGRRDRELGRYDEAIHVLDAGLDAADSLPAVGGLETTLREERLRATRGRMAKELHSLADRIRYRYGIDLPSPHDGEVLIQQCRSLFERRGQILPASDVPALSEVLEEGIKRDLLEVAAVWVDCRVGLATPAAIDDARRDALRILDEAESTAGPSFAIDLRRESLGVGASRTPRDLEPRTAWEYDDQGRHHLRSGRLAPAAEAFRRALDLRPQDFWSNFYSGLVSYRLGQYGDAVAAFRTCVALAPEVATCRYNRALAYDALGQWERALDDDSRALKLDPGFTAARLNRGILSYKLGRFPAAIDDFELALTSPVVDREIRGRLRYNLALARLKLGDRPSATSNAEQALRDGCPEARPLLDELGAGHAVLAPRPSPPSILGPSTR